MTADPTTGLFDLRDRVAVVTGGLGQLGREFCTALIGHGARVAIVDTADPADLPVGWGEHAAVFSADVTQRDSLHAARVAIIDRWEVPQVLVNAAALDSPPNAPHGENGPFESYPEASWDRVMEVNVKGVMLCCQVFGGAMAEAGRGSVINISSIYGAVSPDQRIYEYRRRDDDEFYKPVAYSASKSALMNLTRYLATYWAPRNVRVNTLTMGGVFNDQDPEFLEQYCARVPLGRMADADDYNGAIVFLASDASRYMTGSNVVIDGGWTAW
jgi:NAD(P)-dependent dehydrogenase (short-subunit alcohol dehydrogenase family)